MFEYDIVIRHDHDRLYRHGFGMNRRRRRMMMMISIMVVVVDMIRCGG